jgi:hypothetical protein
MTGSFLSYNAHMKGLQQLLRLRGWNTLHDIPENAPFLRRLIMWYAACKSRIVRRSSAIRANSLLRSDLAYAGLTLSKPYFLPIELIPLISQSLDGLFANKHISAPFLPSTMINILREIRVLSQYLGNDSLTDSERVYFCSTILRTQYQLTTFSAENAFRKRQSQMKSQQVSFHHCSTRPRRP